MAKTVYLTLKANPAKLFEALRKVSGTPLADTSGIGDRVTSALMSEPGMFEHMLSIYGIEIVSREEKDDNT